MIPRDFLHTLLSRVDIVDVVERRIALKKAGANLSARCPFHNEKTASFTVSPSKQFYHCFGCGKHGNAIDFVMEFHGMGFVDAVKELARDAGLDVPAEAQPSPEHERRTDLAGVLKRAAEFYRNELKRSERAIAYLKHRGMSGETAARFGIGYAPEGWQSLARAVPDYADPVLAEAGLVIDADSGRRYDRFRDRVMFPIRNSRGEVIAFGGRVIGEGEPKYLNSPETPVFSKGRELYGAFEGRETIRAAGRIVVVEGYMDVVALHQSGIGYAVATLGTATTPDHVARLLRQCDEVVFCFDGDAAGRRAAWRAMEVSLPLLADGKRVGFVFLPEGDDPDSYVHREGRAAFEALGAAATPLSEFLVRELVAAGDAASDEGKAALVARAKDLVRQVRAPVLGLLLRKRLAEVVGVDMADMNRLVGRSPRSAARAAAPAPDASMDRMLYRKLLLALVARPDLASRVSPGLVEGAHPEAVRAAAVLGLLHADGDITSLASLKERVRGTPEEDPVSQAARDLMTLGDAFDPEPELDGALLRLAAQRMKQAAGPVPLMASDLSDEEKRKLLERVSRGGPQ